MSEKREVVDRIEDLHKKVSKLSANDLIMNLAQIIHVESLNPKAIQILKTYLLRALQREGTL